jgi:hypothetical protein
MPISPQDLKETIEWVRKIESSIDDDISPALHRGEARGGYFSCIRLIFCYSDVFGALLENEVSSKSAVKFIREYFGEVNPRYNDVAGILYSIFRHGTVHTFEPKRFIINNRRFGYVIGKDTDVIPNTDDYKFFYDKKEKGDGHTYTHLVPQTPDPTWPAGMGFPGVQLLPISLERLFRDLKEAVAFYLTDLQNDVKLQEKSFKMMNTIKKPYEFLAENNEVKEKHPLVRNGKEKRKYIDITELSKF